MSTAPSSPSAARPAPAPSATPGPRPEPGLMVDDGRLIAPGRRLAPAPGRDRPWRLLTTLLGAAIVLLVVLALAATSTATWLAGRGYTEVPAITALGSPTSLTLTSATGTVRVLPSGEVDEVTLALVAPGQTTLPEEEARVRARITTDLRGTAATVDVRQPARSSAPPWTPATQDVLLLVPTGPDLALEVRAEVGDVLVDGDFTALHAVSRVGDLRLGPLTAPAGVTATADVGDIDVELGSPAPATVDLTAAVGDVELLLPTDAGGEVTVSADLGDVEVAAPGTERWRVDAASELGDVHQEPGLTEGTGAAIGALKVTSEIGTITLTR
jgi:hypothetical protein